MNASVQKGLQLDWFLEKNASGDANSGARSLHRYGLAHTLLGFLVLTFFAAVVLVPFLYMFLISLKNESEIGSGRFLPEQVAAFFRTGWSDAVWIEAKVTKSQAAVLAKGAIA